MSKQVTFRFFAGAAEVAGTGEMAVQLPDDASLATAVDSVADGNERLATVLARSSLLVDERAETDRDVRLADGVTVDVLPPFAGG